MLSNSHGTGNMDVVVLGAGGFIGQNIVREFSGERVFCVRGFSSKDADLTDAKAAAHLYELIPRTAALVITSAVSGHGQDTLATLRGNILIAMNVAALISAQGVSHVVYLSTIDVYGNHEICLPLSESSAIRPGSYYAISKYFSEIIILKACRDRSVPATILRLPGVYGPRDRSKRIVASSIAAARENRKLTVTGDGSQRRDLVYVGDIARLVRRILINRVAGLFNVVTGESRSVNDILEIVETLSGRRLEVDYDRDRKQFDLVFEKSAILKFMPDFTFTALLEGIRSTYEFFERNRDGEPG